MAKFGRSIMVSLSMLVASTASAQDDNTPPDPGCTNVAQLCYESFQDFGYNSASQCFDDMTSEMHCPVPGPEETTPGIYIYLPGGPIYNCVPSRIGPCTPPLPGDPPQ